MDDILSRFEQMFGWVPQWMVGLGLVVGAIVVALFVHGIAARILKRALGVRWPAVTLLLQRIAGPARLALCLVAVALVLPLAQLNDVLREQLRHFFIVAVIALIGWITVRAVDMGAARYLQRFRLDTDENFLARLIVGLAARPLLSNLIAGVQIAITQPIRIEDAVIIENEWGWVEDIASTYVVIRLWDWRRMVVPLSYFIERPFQNWTRDTQSLIGAIAFHVDYCTDVSRIRQRLEEAVRESKLWDGAVVNLQVIEASPRAIELRALVSARSAPQSWDLRCEIREKLLAFIREEMPEAFPRERAMVSPPLADFEGSFEHGDARSRPIPVRTHN